MFGNHVLQSIAPDILSTDEIKQIRYVVAHLRSPPFGFCSSQLSVNPIKTHAMWPAASLDPLMVGSEYLWPGRFHERLHILTRQYARIVQDWVASLGLEVSAYGTHSMRRTNVRQIYKKTGNLRAVQFLMGYTKIDSTVRYLGFEMEDALAIAEAMEI